MRKIIFFLCLFVCSHLYAQTIRVVEKTTNVSVEGTEVSVHGKSALGVTNAAGEFTLTNVSGQDTLVFYKTGYLPERIAYSEIQGGISTIELRVIAYDLNEVIISGSRFGDAKRDIAQDIKTINAQAIAFNNAGTAADLLQNSGQVLVQKSQAGGGSPVLRGFEASRVLLVVDGVRMNNAIYRAGHLQNIITMDQSILEGVEIAFGPSSVNYGSDALGGVIHFRTKKPDLLTEGEKLLSAHAFLRYGTVANEKTGHLDFNLANTRFASLTSVTISDFDDLKAGSVPNKDNEYGSFNFRPFYVETINGVDSIIINDDSTVQVQTGYTQYDILQKFLFQQNENVYHGINFQYSTSTDIPRYDRLTDPGDEPGTLGSSQWYYGPQNRMMVAYNLDVTGNNGAFDKLQIIPSFQAIEESRHNRGFEAGNLTHRTENINVIGLNIDLRKGIKNNQLNYGAEMYLNDVTSVASRENVETGEITPQSTRYPDGGSGMNNFSVYANHILKFGNNKWVLNDGLRFNVSMLHAEFIDTSFYPFPFSEIDQNNNAVTGSLGIIYLPDDTWKISLIGSSGFRTPNVDDLTKIFDSSPGSVLVPNPDLKPEYSYNADLHISKIIADKVEVEATGFYTRFTNYLGVEPGTFNGEDSILYDGVLSGVSTPVNKDNAYLYGINAGIDVGITKTISLASYITYTYGRIETDSTPYPLDHIPPLYGKTSLNFQFTKFRAELYALYNGWKKIEDYNIVGGEDNQQYATPDGMPSWYTVNIKASYAVAKYVQVQAGCENMLDLNYRVFASGISAPGRNIYVALRASI
ncbi:MAG: TonB-dependent receptor [Chitinophagales bacterium]|nr:TonB-dependent receptor [Chitinophagales bacterium]